MLATKGGLRPECTSKNIKFSDCLGTKRQTNWQLLDGGINKFRGGLVHDAVVGLLGTRNLRLMINDIS